MFDAPSAGAGIIQGGNHRNQSVSVDDLLTGFEFADERLADIPSLCQVQCSIDAAWAIAPPGRAPRAASMAVAPMHVITKPAAGTGGSYLQDLTSAIATSSTDTDWLRPWMIPAPEGDARPGPSEPARSRTKLASRKGLRLMARYIPISN